MKIIEKLFGSAKNRKTGLILITTGIFLMIAANIIGISDNPPGIILAFLSICAIMLAFVHHWTKLKMFLILLIGSIVGFPVFAVLHNLFHALGKMAKDIIIVEQLLEILDVSSFLIAIFLCPIGIILGAVGSIVLSIKNKKKK